MGRPTKYKPEYCKQIEEFFDIDPYREVTDVYTYKDGTTKETIKLLPNDMIFMGDFARKIGVNKDTLYEWAKKYPEFSDSLKRANELQERLLVVNGLNGVYNSTFAIFAAKNMIGWRDKQELEHSNPDGSKLFPVPILVHMNVPTDNRNSKDSPASKTD
jgi:hypothetical protein